MREYRTWRQITQTLTPDDVFRAFSDILNDLDMTISDAWLTFKYDFELACSRYDDNDIVNLCQNVYTVNRIKYQKMVDAAKAKYDPIDNYNMTETSTDVRTPDLTSQLSLNTSTDFTDTRSVNKTSNSTSTTTQNSSTNISSNSKEDITQDTSTNTTNNNTSTTDGTTDTTTTNQINQQRTTTDTPNNYDKTSIHYVNPSDDTGFAESYKDTSTESGSKTITESYSGNPDKTVTDVSGNSKTTDTGSTDTTTSGNTKTTASGDQSTTTSGGTKTTDNGDQTTTTSGGTKTTNIGTNTQTETGTEKTEHTLTRKGNIGVTTSQQMIESELLLAAKMDIFKAIEQDIAAKIFLQVWI